MVKARTTSKRIGIFFASVLLLLVVLPKSIDGFKLKDLSAHEQEDGNKSPRKVPLRSVDSKTSQFRKIVKVVKVNDDDEEESDIENEPEFKFEKVRKADVDTSEPIFKTIAKEVEKEEDVVVEEATEKLSFSILSLLNVFGVGTNEAGHESNSIINWLKSLKRKEAAQQEPQSPTEESNAGLVDNWTAYLNRWPFNLVFQFEIPAAETEGHSDTVNVTKANSMTEPPISQEQFDYLLDRLPSFVVDPESAEEVECKKQLQIYGRQLRGQKLWTLQMLDSTGKISSGILRGNINQFGDFDQCTHIRTVVKISPDQSVRIKGKYCLAHIDVELIDNGLKLPIYMALGRGLFKSNFQNPSHFVPRYTTANWGVCIPNECSPSTVKKMLENDFKTLNASGVYFHIDVNERDCYVRRSQSITHLIYSNWKLSLTIGFYGSFLLLVILGTTTEYWNIVKQFLIRNIKNLLKQSKPNLEREASVDEQPDDPGNPDLMESNDEYSSTKLIKEVILSFSLKRTFTRLIYSNPEEDIVAMNGLKVLATFLMYLFLKFLMIGHLPITNRDKMVKVLSQPFSIMLRTPLMYLDTLLFVSGTLSAFRMCTETEQKAGISVMRRIVGRLIRSLPTLFAVLYFQSWILPHLGSGPLWSNLISHNTKLCEQNMWRNFFTAQNAINLEETCSPFTIQLAVDLQLYLLAPLIVWLYYNNPDVGLSLYGILHTISVAARFSRTTTDRLSPIIFHGMNVSQFYRTANIVYSSPIQRATPYISGIGMGILLKSTERSFRLPRATLCIGWLTSIWSLIWCFWYPSHSTHVDFVYDPAEMAPYASWAPLLLSVALAWITYTSFTGNAPELLNSIVSSKIMHFLSRIAYPMQVVSYVVVIYTTGVTKEQTRFDILELANFQEIIVIILASTILAIVFDLPMQNIRKLLIEFEFPEQKMQIEAIEDADHNRISWIEDKNDRIEDDRTINQDEEGIEDQDYADRPSQESWTADKEDLPDRYNLKIHEKLNGNTEFQWNTYQDTPDESWRTESDLDQQDSNNDSQEPEDEAHESNYLQEDEVHESNHLHDPENETEEEEENGHEAVDEENEEEEEEISESDEIVRRPLTLSSEQNFRRRNIDRWNLDED